MEKNRSLNWKTITVLAGGFLSYVVGSGFASGNEILQFFASWGTGGAIASIVTCAVLTAVACVCLYLTGQYVQFESTFELFQYFCGRKIGFLLKLFTVGVIGGACIMMFSGAGSVLSQVFGLPQLVGAIGIGVLSGIIVLGGLKTVENVLGYCGIFLLAAIVIFSVISLFHPNSSIDQAQGVAEAVDEGKIWQANFFTMPPFSWIPGLADMNNAVIAGILYAGQLILSAAAFLVATGKNISSSLEAKVCGITSSVVVYICVALVCVLLLFNFNSVINPSTGEMYAFPTLAAITNLWPAGAVIFMAMICIGIFTSLSGYLWTLSDWFFPDQSGTAKHKIFVLVLLILGVLLGGNLSFSAIISFLLTIAGLVGVLFLIAVIVKTIKVVKKGKVQE